ncbi:MAG TPA: site-2 protease family protein [Planctomycetota bacterium]|nr:site-2 protease family protein [Planctomycetota bacterium]
MFPGGVGTSSFDLNFRVFGVPARIHPTFWLAGLFFVGRTPNLYFLLIGIATLFVSILVHEMGHALCGKYYGDRSPSITLYIMGGYYMPGSISLRRWKEIWMCLWGPLAGFILGALALGLSVAVNRALIPYSDMLDYVLDCAIWINILWGLVNLLPVFPLDGGQILREIVRWKFPRKTDATAYLISMVTAIVVAALSAAAAFKYGNGLYAALLFGSLAFQNYQLRRISILTGDYHEEEAPRQPWEQDADWWKSGRKDDDADWWKR